MASDENKKAGGPVTPGKKDTQGTPPASTGETDARPLGTQSDLDGMHLDVGDLADALQHTKKPKHGPSSKPLPPSREWNPKDLLFSRSALWLVGGFAVLVGSFYLLRSNPVLAPKAEKIIREITNQTYSSGPTVPKKKAPSKLIVGKKELPGVEPLAEEDIANLPEEEQLARVDPAWRKKWETYKRLFMLSQQMHQQPPARPRMPNATPDPTPDVSNIEEDPDAPNPFGFPEPDEETEE